VLGVLALMALALSIQLVLWGCAQYRHPPKLRDVGLAAVLVGTAICLAGQVLVLLPAGILLAVLARRKLPRWVRGGLLAVVAAGIIASLLAGATALYAQTYDRNQFKKRSRFYNTGLNKAIRAGDVAKVRALLAGRPGLIRERDLYGNDALLLAVKTQDKHMAEALLARGADVNSYNANNESPMVAAAKAGNEELVRLLIARGGDVNAGHHWTSPLSAAVEGGHEDVADLLRSHGAK